MKIKQLFFITYAGMALGIIILVSIILLIVNNQEQLNASQERRYESYLRADELRQSSDDLTRLARTYVVSGDDKYEKMYMDILAIRKGEKARPQNYERIYWDLVLEYGQKPRPDSTVTKKLNDIMKELGFTQKEFDLLTEANNNSNGLVNTEVIAMNAIKGEMPKDAMDLLKEEETPREMAIRIMHDGTYHSNKANIMKPIDEFFVLLEERTGNEVQAAKENNNFLLTIAVIAAVVMVLLIMLIGIFVTRRIMNQLGEDPSVLANITESVAKGDLEIDDISTMKEKKGVFLSIVNMVEALKIKAQALENIAKGDLSIIIDKTSERDSLGESLQVMTGSLNEMITRVNTSADKIAVSSQSLANASDLLAAGASSQASSTEEITAAITEIAQQTKKNAKNAVEASEISIQAKENAEKGNGQMVQLVGAMSDINSSADEITKIVKTIDDIAFQINLLALNANVEAARAGKYGKGFAVVAEEVRNLAARSARSVQETTKMVEQATSNIDRGNKLVEVTAQQLQDIQDGASRVSTFLKTVVTANQEQSSSLDEISNGLNRINDITQDNTANAEETATASTELAGQAQMLKNVVGQFVLKTANTNTGIQLFDR